MITNISVLLALQVLSEHMYAMAKCIEVLGSGCLTEEQMQELVKMLDKVLNDHFDRASKRHEKRKDEDYDEVNIFVIFIHLQLRKESSDVSVQRNTYIIVPTVV